MILFGGGSPGQCPPRSRDRLVTARKETLQKTDFPRWGEPYDAEEDDPEGRGMVDEKKGTPTSYCSTGGISARTRLQESRGKQSPENAAPEKLEKLYVASERG